MKLAVHQLTQHLNQSLAAIYVVSGDEPLLIQETLDQIRTTAKKQGFSERIRIPVENTDWGKLFYSNVHSLSLFATKRLLELDLSTTKLNSATSKILQEYAAAPPEDILLLIRTHKLDSKSEQSSWYKAIAKIGVMIPLWPITIEQLPAWIAQRAKKLNLNMTTTAAELLAGLVEGNLLAATQELEKLRLLHTTDTIDQRAIENAVNDHAHFDIFNLVDSALAGNIKRSLRILNALKAEDMEPTLVLWALTRELRTMIDIIKQIQQGVSIATLFPKYRIFEKRQPSVRAFLQRHKNSNCFEFLATAAGIDRIIKGAEIGNVWDELERFILVLSFPPSRE